MMKANKGEWGEPYAAIKILGDSRLFSADSEGNRIETEWMNIYKLIRNESKGRVVTYCYDENSMMIDVYINGTIKNSTPVVTYKEMAVKMSEMIKQGKGSSFEAPKEIHDFLIRIGMNQIRATSINKSDVFLCVRDPRSGIARENIGFSIKSEFGHDPTLFNTASASAFIYELSNMDEDKMSYVNSLVDHKGHAAVSERCDWLINNGCNPRFVGLPIALRAKCKAFEENLDLLNPRLIELINSFLSNHFFKHEGEVRINKLTEKAIAENPCHLTRPEFKYPYMVKSFLYAAYSGMTASTLWNGRSQVNGGFIKVGSDGDVSAQYAMESDLFKNYLYEHCYLEFPSSEKGHGNYAKVYEENGIFYFRLNFQIRYQ